MRTLIQNHDLKRLFGGAAIAVVAGLTIGAAFQPALDEDGIHAPQQLMSGGGVRTYAANLHQGVGAYPGQVPDYVIGTDWVRPAVPEQETLAYDDRAATQADDAEAYAEPASAIAPARWEDEPPEPPLYPSERGNTYYDADLPAPPEPPTDEEFEPSAP
jgi:hypothetical protein